jgi:hypothetical protein
MERIILQPTLDELQTGDKHLPEMQRYITHLVAEPDKQVAARNASLAYLALIQAFAAEGLLQLAWAPRLVFDLGDQEYEVSQAREPDGTKLMSMATDRARRIDRWYGRRRRNRQQKPSLRKIANSETHRYTAKWEGYAVYELA